MEGAINATESRKPNYATSSRLRGTNSGLKGRAADPAFADDTENRSARRWEGKLTFYSITHMTPGLETAR